MLVLPAAPSAADDTALRSLWDKGEKELAEGKFNEALGSFQEALALDSENGRTWNYLGALCFAQKDYYKALLRFKRAAEASPQDPRIFNNLGTTYDQLGRYELAIENYLTAIRIDPAYTPPYRNLGAIYAYKVPDLETAESYWNTYLELYPESPEADNIREEITRLKSKP